MCKTKNGLLKLKPTKSGKTYKSAVGEPAQSQAGRLLNY